jgi:hypothetical protein
LTLFGILLNGWLALQELGRHKAAALQIRRRLTNTVDQTEARNAPAQGLAVFGQIYGDELLRLRPSRGG